MTEYEFISLMTMLGQEAAYHSMNFIALLFAYCLVTFFTAATLSRLQVWMVTLLYCSILFAPITANLKAVNNLQNLSTEFIRLYPDSVMEYSAWSVRAPLLLAVYLAAWLMSILFMFQWRKHQKT